MEAENSESMLAISNSSFLNRTFVKGFLAGIVIGGVGIPWALIISVFGLDEIDGPQDWTFYILNCVLPILLLYFAGKVVTSALGRYGFEGWISEYMSLRQLFSAMLGLFTACVFFVIVLSILSIVWAFFVTGI